MVPEKVKRKVRVIHAWATGRVYVVHRVERLVTLSVGGSVALGIHSIEIVASGALAVVMLVALFAEEEG